MANNRKLSQFATKLETGGVLPSEDIAFDNTGTGLAATTVQDAIEEIKGDIGDGPVGEINTASNLGSGAGLYASKSGVDLRFKSLIEGQGIDIASSSTALTIRSVVISASDPGAIGAGMIWVTPN